jgi:hypothetical protein
MRVTVEFMKSWGKIFLVLAVVLVCGGLRDYLAGPVDF